MPTYDYQCRACGSMTEVIHSMLEDGPSTCERCGGDLRRVLYPTGIIFKGSGFYRTDSRTGGADSSRTDGSKASDRSADASATAAEKKAPPSDGSGKAAEPTPS